MKNKIYLFSILALVLMSSCTVSQFGYTPEPINQNKIKASASTNVEINNLRVFRQKTTFPNIIKDIEHTMLNEMDEIFTSTSKDSDLIIKIKIDELKNKQHLTSMFFIPYMFLGLPLGTVDAAFDVDVLLYTNTPNPKLIKKYSSQQEISKIFGIYYGNRARNPKNKRYIPYIMMQEAMKDIKMQILQDRNLILQKINENKQNKTDEVESHADNNDNTNNLNISNTNILLRNSEAIREQWKLKGGKLYSTTVSGGISYLSYNNDGISMKGNGFNLGLSRGFYKFKAPQYTTGRSTWSSFSLFESIEFSQMKSTIEMAEIPDITSEYQNLSVSIQLGFVKGIGRFITESKWKGLIFGINYKPTVYQDVSNSDSDPYFNYTSFSIDISSASFNSAMNKIAPKPGYKFSLFVLPPIDDKPLFINASLGITLYN